LAGDVQSHPKSKRLDPEDEGAYPPFANDTDPWAAHFAEIDALLDRTSNVLARETPLPKNQSHLVYDPDIDEAENEDLWLEVVKRTSHWPAIAAAAVTWQAWPILTSTPPAVARLIMAASILRARGLPTLLPPLAAGFKQAKFRPQGWEGAQEKLKGFAKCLRKRWQLPTRISTGSSSLAS
jgi:hypothetical protein